MLSISAIGGDGSYYLDLAEEDYYLKGGEPEGVWIGSGVTRYHLQNQKVDEQSLKSLLLGYHPDSPDKAVLNAGKKNRQKGYDFCFSAPKSVSLAFAGGDKNLQDSIRKAHQKAVEIAVDYLEKHATVTRRGNQGSHLERAKLMVAVFEHSTSRALDPNLHSHCLVMNVCDRFDGTTGTLYGSVVKDDFGRVIETFNPLYRNKMAAGAVYRMELAHQLVETLGCRLQLSDNGFSFEVEGFTDKVIREFSKRSDEIGEKLKQLGFESSAAAENVALTTRLSKIEVNRQKLFKKWRSQLEKVGYGHKAIRTLFPVRFENQKEELLITKENLIKDTVVQQYTELVESGRSVEIKDLYQKAAIQLQTSGISFSELDSEIQRQLTDGKIVSLGVDRLSHQISAEEILKQESRANSILEESKKDIRHGVITKIIDKEFERNRRSIDFTLSTEQRQAIRYLTEVQLEDHSGSIRVLTGDAGSGKTTVLKTASEIWQKGGYRVVGACLSNKAARELEDASGIPSHSIAKWNYEINKSAKSAALHHGKMLYRATRKKTTYLPEREFHFDKKTVLVIDEVAMADTTSVLKLVDEAIKKGAKISLSGDNKQCPAITNGGFFAAAVSKIESFRLKQNWRQRHHEDREIVKLFSERKTDLALRRMAARGQVVVKDSEQSALKSLVSEWSAKGVKDPKENVVIVMTHNQRQEANRLCQAKRIGKFKRLLPISIKNHEGQNLHINDRVQFRENLFAIDNRKKYQRIANGTFGTVIGINLKTEKLTIRMDDGRKLLVDSKVQRKQNGWFHPIRKTKAHISLGYASTTHSLQGATVDRSYVLAGGSMQDAELTYVQMSRARYGTTLFTSREQAGQELTWLAENYRSKEIPELVKITDRKFQQKHRVESSMLCKSMARSREKLFSLQRSLELQQKREQDKETQQKMTREQGI